MYNPQARFNTCSIISESHFIVNIKLSQGRLVSTTGFPVGDMVFN